MTTAIDYAWAAGLLEGEGSFFVKTGTYSPVVSCEMTDLDVLERLKNIFGGSIYAMSRRNEKWKDTWRWKLYGDNAVQCMQLILPYMLKRRTSKIKELIELHASRQEAKNIRNEAAIMAATDYLANKGSLRSLAKQYGVSHETVRRTSESLVP